MLIIGCCRLHTLTIKYDTETSGATDYKFSIEQCWNLELNLQLTEDDDWRRYVSLSTPSRYNLPPTGSNVEILNIIILIVNYILAISTEQTRINFTLQATVNLLYLKWLCFDIKSDWNFCNLCQVVTLWFTDQKYFQIQVRCCWRVKLQCVASTRGHPVLETSMITFILVIYMLIYGLFFNISTGFNSLQVFIFNIF